MSVLGTLGPVVRPRRPFPAKYELMVGLLSTEPNLKRVIIDLEYELLIGRRNQLSRKGETLPLREPSGGLKCLFKPSGCIRERLSSRNGEDRVGIKLN